ncbi:MAG TPA: formate--tetrahydrofolate ligase, partial [Candidatus Omnitrophica bacterium]|nr:formate--tetrahydrofolate ligase [Candidatus Omnitrophota bacterium]
LNNPLKEKIETIATQVYSAKGIEFSSLAEEKITHLQTQNLDKLAINMAKTQFSLTHDPKIKGLPLENWILKIRDILIYNGAGFITPVTGKMLLLPGLPQKPNYERFRFKDS